MREEMVALELKITAAYDEMRTKFLQTEGVFGNSVSALIVAKSCADVAAKRVDLI